MDAGAQVELAGRGLWVPPGRGPGQRRRPLTALALWEPAGAASGRRIAPLAPVRRPRDPAWGSTDVLALAVRLATYLLVLDGIVALVLAGLLGPAGMAVVLLGAGTELGAGGDSRAHPHARPGRGAGERGRPRLRGGSALPRGDRARRPRPPAALPGARALFTPTPGAMRGGGVPGLLHARGGSSAAFDVGFLGVFIAFLPMSPGSCCSSTCWWSRPPRRTAWWRAGARRGRARACSWGWRRRPPSRRSSSPPRCSS